ncbi:putative S-adenosylmethionine-dependent methyltransferase/MSMEI_2290 [Methylacidimicrobium cyclopophantes]|uniref:S-adenosylmethionine-dependent methyltransferase/MSMEI_2290 n=1 Tax=Methylacidimicrobium cyclopophantes TaxID=1041766 RepID=A0A5E6MCI0_9BACT|nr:class I SAM-dependent methyltransferase [Methylacidimicrobium cyclopophantes]VVM06948.1 putative S-adenosylmethionine-dependent methyltransferase/MSMEI_2290 [Methylacidimicrobium cyclopophantes]
MAESGNERERPGLAPRARPEIHRKVKKLLRRLALPQSARVLDVPLGPGAMAEQLRRDGFSAWGADLDLAQSEGLHPSIRRERADLNGPLPFPDQFFDLVLSLEGIEHLENPFQFIREIARVCRPGGYLILSTPNICNLEERLNFLARGTFYRYIPAREFAERGSGFDHQNLMTWVEIRQLLDWNGFSTLGLFRDKIKWKQLVFLGPLGFFLWAFGRLQSRQRREKYCWGETESGPVLFGGSTLIVLAKKEAKRAQ